MENEIKLLKNNQKRDWPDLEWVEEFYRFLQGEIPEGISLSRGSKIKLSNNKAFSIIWYLQEHFSILPDGIEKCDTCKSLYDSSSSGYHSELTEKFYCDSCYPSFLDSKEQRILELRAKKNKQK